MCISYFLLPRIDDGYNLEYDLGKNMEYLYMLVMSHHGTAAKPSRQLGFIPFSVAWSWGPAGINSEVSQREETASSCSVSVILKLTCPTDKVVSPKELLKSA